MLQHLNRLVSLQQGHQYVEELERNTAGFYTANTTQIIQCDIHVQLHSKYFKISKYSSHTVHLCTHNDPLTFPIKTLSPCSTLSSVYELCGRNSVHQGVCVCGCVGVGVGGCWCACIVLHHIQHSLTSKCLANISNRSRMMREASLAQFACIFTRASILSLDNSGLGPSVLSSDCTSEAGNNYSIYTESGIELLHNYNKITRYWNL